jgi:hypothetical protein
MGERHTKGGGRKRKRKRKRKDNAEAQRTQRLAEKKAENPREILRFADSALNDGIGLEGEAALRLIESGPPRNPIRGANNAPQKDGPYNSKIEPGETQEHSQE